MEHTTLNDCLDLVNIHFVLYCSKSLTGKVTHGFKLNVKLPYLNLSAGSPWHQLCDFP